MIGNYIRTLNKIFVISGILVLSAMSTFASANTLNGLKISQNENGIYNILLKNENSSDIKTIRNTNNKLTILLKSVLPADSVEISYNNAPELNNVAVQKMNGNKTVIVLEGNSVQNALVNELDLSNGTLNENIGETVLPNGFSPLNDKKILYSCLLSIFMTIMLFVSLKPKKYTTENSIETAEELRNAIKNANTLRKKNKLQSKNIPSINYKVKGYTSVPKGFVINKYKEEKIKKAG